ncbi:MAG: DUF1566 domain-containing protein [Spirochaetia bacterium]|jgi:hypothetical protein|nr:DUF1566 domain-containing protein [Spirochaetia bacterium]
MKIQLKLAAFLLLSATLLMIGCSIDGSDDSVPAKYAIGDKGPSGVGIVFYVTDGGLHGLEVAPVDQDTGTVWSNNYSGFANGSTALPAEIGTGSANTDAIIAQTGHTGSAAKICRDYTGGELTDWFLPSKDELKAIWDNLVDDGAGNNSGAGDFATGGYGYWSSSENTAALAWYQSFFSGPQTHMNKSSSTSVRAVRSF